MRKETVWRAKEIVKRGDIILLDVSPGVFHFLVKQRDSKWTDVWLNKTKTGEIEWSCNAVTKKKTGDTWCCVMNNKADKSKPYCSHTLASKIYLTNLGSTVQQDLFKKFGS